MRYVIALILTTLILAACTERGNMSGKADLWERGAENNSSSPCDRSSCFGD